MVRHGSVWFTFGGVLFHRFTYAACFTLWERLLGFGCFFCKKKKRPTSGQEARPSAAYSELVDVLSRATEKLALDWPDEPRESRASKLDERFLSGSNSKPEWRKLPFFGYLHQEISRSWKQPFSSRLTNAAAADFTNLVGSVEQGYTAMTVVEDILASHLSPSLVPSWKYRQEHSRYTLNTITGQSRLGTCAVIRSELKT